MFCFQCNKRKILLKSFPLLLKLFSLIILELIYEGLRFDTIRENHSIASDKKEWFFKRISQKRQNIKYINVL